MRRAAAAFFLTLFLPQAEAQAVTLSRQYHYYTISARSEAELQRALSLRGPYIAETGSRHAAAARIGYSKSLQFAPDRRLCRVQTAQIHVSVALYLPQWRESGSLGNTETGRFWRLLAADMRKHEETHISIARNFALAMEQELAALPARADCRAAQADADAVMRRLTARANAEQQAFDAREGKRAPARIAAMRKQARAQAGGKSPHRAEKLRAHP